MGGGEAVGKRRSEKVARWRNKQSLPTKSHTLAHLSNKTVQKKLRGNKDHQRHYTKYARNTYNAHDNIQLCRSRIRHGSRVNRALLKFRTLEMTHKEEFRESTLFLREWIM